MPPESTWFAWEELDGVCPIVIVPELPVASTIGRPVEPVTLSLALAVPPPILPR